MKMKIAISLVCHNDEEVLKPCIESLLSSDINKHEIKLFVYDNNSNEEILRVVETLPKKGYKNKLFLFCAGPLGNMLAAKMWENNKNNTYIDIDSTLNSQLMGVKNRGYLRGLSTIKKKCIWEI